MRFCWWWIGVGLFIARVPAHGQDASTMPALPRNVVQEVLRLWNAPGTLRVTGPYLIEASRDVSTDVGISDGELTVAGRVGGRIIAINASVRLTNGAQVDGEILVVGGELTREDSATVGGAVRVYGPRLDYARDGDRLIAAPDTGAGRWWQRRERRKERNWSDLRLVSARTYNRVEGLPVLLGPNFGRDLGWGRVSVDAYLVWRSVKGFTWDSEKIGHSLRAEVQIGGDRGLRLGARQSDLVEPVESWHLSDEEVGLASAVLHRDYRDYFNQSGGSLYASLFRGRAFDATISYADRRWRDRRTLDPWTLFRNSDRWRENPILDEGMFHLVNGTLRYDTRNDAGNPWTGWYILADYEYGTGRITKYGLASPGTRTETLDGETVYDRLFLDVRRYNRISPSSQLNLRLVTGGWLSGDDLPMQRRFSLGGPGTLAGYDFRRALAGPDVWQCGTPGLQDTALPIGTPAECERFAMAQVELRGDMHLDLFGMLDEERERRRAGWGRGTEWVLFADAGRGWLVGEPDGGRSYGTHALPALSTFRTDIGIGLVLDNVGVYLAKSLSVRAAPVNFFVRLRPRF